MPDAAAALDAASPDAPTDGPSGPIDAGAPDATIDASPDATVDATVDAQECTEDQFTCASGDCILAIYECDGFPDCADSSDESPLDPNCS
jgi:hypothetical protein